MPPPTMLETIRQINPTVITESPCWLYAAEIRLEDDTWLYVYRSAELRDDDEDYEPVIRCLSNRSWSPIFHDEYPDDDMMFGKAELWVYRLRK